MDLRYLAQINGRNHQTALLGDLAKKYLKIELAENHRLKRENWKKKKIQLNGRDIDYAAKTVRVAIELFKYLENESANQLQSFIDGSCKPHLNHIFRYETKEGDQKQETNEDDQPQVTTNELLPIKVHLISNYTQCRDILQQFREYNNSFVFFLKRF